MGFEICGLFYESPAGLKLASLSVPRPGETAYICAVSTQMLSPSGHVAVSPGIWSYLGTTRSHLRDVNEST